MLGNIGAQFIPHSVAKETGEALGFFLWESERKTGEKMYSELEKKRIYMTWTNYISAVRC